MNSNVMIIGGDMNAKGGNNKFCLNYLPYRNGEYLQMFLSRTKIICLNTKFSKKDGELWIYTYPSNSKAQLDYIFINK